MSTENKFYITTTLPYVNAEPHIGFAAEIIKADLLARYNRLLGADVFFNTGTDEHGQKIYQKAEEEGMDVQKYVDKYATKFNDLKKALDLSFDNFIRTTDAHHVKAAQEFWKICEENGDIYKKEYKIKYCVGCELEKTDSELVNDYCEFHPYKELETIEEENYFFRFSKYQDKLLEFYKNNPEFVVPNHRFNEIKAFVERGLEDFSVSRLKEKMPWGIAVPGDDDQVMYVWFDALVNYISALGWSGDEKKFKEFWPGVQVCGKDNLRQQSAMWQAMLMSAGLPTSKQVLVFGFISSNGQKMSKSLGNVVSPFELVEKYGTDATRYFLLTEVKPFADSDFSFEKFDLLYNAHLANGLGNLVARVSAILEKNNIEVKLEQGNDKELVKNFEEKMSEYKFDEALKVLWDKIRESDEFLSDKKPWKMEKAKEIKKVLEPVAQNILNISILLEPFMPETAKKIQKQFLEKNIKKQEALFPRI